MIDVLGSIRGQPFHHADDISKPLQQTPPRRILRRNYGLHLDPRAVEKRIRCTELIERADRSCQVSVPVIHGVPHLPLGNLSLHFFMDVFRLVLHDSRRNKRCSI